MSFGWFGGGLGCFGANMAGRLNLYKLFLICSSIISTFFLSYHY